PKEGRPQWEKPVAIFFSLAAAVTMSFILLGGETNILDVPLAIVVGAIYFQPAVLMILPRRGASLDLAAGVIASILGAGLIIIPYALAFPPFLVVAVLSVMCGIAAFAANSYSHTRGDALAAVLAALLTAAATFTSELDHLFRCRSGPVPLFCVTGDITLFGAAATVAALWLACLVVWLVAGRSRREGVSEPVSADAGGR
ncbi:MAG: hypothetical protein WAT66_14870, partial [Actinomycetota bacterium]